MRQWKAWMIAAVVIVWSMGAAAATHKDDTRIVVRVYHAPEDERWLGDALANAAVLLSGVSVNVDWISCDGGSIQPLRCHVAPAPGELAVRVSRVARRDEDATSLPLGDSLIDRRAHAGTLATIYVNRIVWLAAQSSTMVSTLAGRTIAHELGHLLMATSAHDTIGLMRAHWTVPELARDDPRDWMFTSADAKAIRRRVSRDTAFHQARLAQPSRSADGWATDISVATSTHQASHQPGLLPAPSLQ